MTLFLQGIINHCMYINGKMIHAKQWFQGHITGSAKIIAKSKYPSLSIKMSCFGLLLNYYMFLGTQTNWQNYIYKILKFVFIIMGIETDGRETGENCQSKLFYFQCSFFDLLGNIQIMGHSHNQLTQQHTWKHYSQHNVNV